MEKINRISQSLFEFVSVVKDFEFRIGDKVYIYGATPKFIYAITFPKIDIPPTKIRFPRTEFITYFSPMRNPLIGELAIIDLLNQKMNPTSEIKDNPKESSQLFVKCIIKNKFQNLTVGKEYPVVEKPVKDGNELYYHITNDAGVTAFYNIKYFTTTYEKQEEKKKDSENEIKPGYCLCILPTEGLSLNKQYKIINNGTNTVSVKTDTGDFGNYLRKRFKFNPNETKVGLTLD